MLGFPVERQKTSRWCVIVGVGFRSLVVVVVVHIGCGFIQRVRLCRKPPVDRCRTGFRCVLLTGIVSGEEFDL